MSDTAITVTLTQGTPEWAFVAACRALDRLAKAGVDMATVTLYHDGSGELRIPGESLVILRKQMTPDELYDLVGSVRRDDDRQDLVIRQCGGFAYRDLAAMPGKRVHTGLTE